MNNQDTSSIRIARREAERTVARAAHRRHRERVALLVVLAWTIFATSGGWWLRGRLACSTAPMPALAAEPAPTAWAPVWPTAQPTAQPAAQPTASADGISIAWLPASVARWEARLVTAGRAHGVDPELLAIVMLVESGGNPNAVSRSGAVGLMQIMPSTAAGVEAERGLVRGACNADARGNVDCGAYYLAQQLRAFGRTADPDWQQSVELAAAAYNGGPGSVLSGRLPAEAQRYRQWVGGMWHERRLRRSTTYDAWLAAGGQRLLR